jgi:non-specific serine/threonine protein kinase
MQALGAAAADHERQAGRTMPASAALDLAHRVARPDRPEAADAALTPRQLEVAALVAASKTNRQIGKALGISEKTAEIHVRNIMDRLHTTNRAGIAAWIAARGALPVSSATPAP